jgi:hypothetical protein
MSVAIHALQTDFFVPQIAIRFEPRPTASRKPFREPAEPKRIFAPEEKLANS